MASTFPIKFVVLLLLSIALLGVVQYRSHERLESYLREETGSHRRLISESERPIMYTYFEQSESYKPGDDSMDLLENWRKSWYDMGWNPMILTIQQAQQLPEYEELMKLIPNSPLLRGDVLPSYRRWMAMAAVGGGWMCDFTVFPLNYFLQHGRVLPHDGAMTTYMGTSPVLVSGNGDEYRRLVRHIGQTASKMVQHQEFLNENYPENFKKFVVWNDGVALQELRKTISQDMFKTRSDVTERSRMENADGSVDCDVARGKKAVFYRGLAPTPNENRGAQARKFMNLWRAACGVSQSSDLVSSAK